MYRFQKLRIPDRKQKTTPGQIMAKSLNTQKRKSSKQPEEKDMSHTEEQGPEQLPVCCQKHWWDKTLDNNAGPDLSSQEHIPEERRQNQSLLTSIPAQHSSQGRTNETHREWLTFKKTLPKP